MNKLEPEEYNIDKIFKEALGFSRTYYILKDTINQSNIDKIDLLTPMLTSLIFSCELYLKLLLIHYEKDFKYTHSLNTLFELLPEETQIDIEKIFNKQCFEKTYFKQCLKLSDTCYEKFRYYFSYKDNITIHMTFFENFNDILFRKVKSTILITE